MIHDNMLLDNVKYSILYGQFDTSVSHWQRFVKSDILVIICDLQITTKTR